MIRYFTCRYFLSLTHPVPSGYALKILLVYAGVTIGLPRMTTCLHAERLPSVGFIDRKAFPAYVIVLGQALERIHVTWLPSGYFTSERTIQVFRKRWIFSSSRPVH